MDIQNIQYMFIWRMIAYMRLPSGCLTRFMDLINWPSNILGYYF